MTGNVKTLHKHNETIGLGNAEGNLKRKIKPGYTFLVWYVPLSITIIACLALSMLSLRLSYLTSESVKELRDEVSKLKTILDNTWIREMSDFQQALYQDYNAEKSRKSRGPKIVNKPLNKKTTDVIGVIKYTEADGSTTVNPESLLIKALSKTSELNAMGTQAPTMEMNMINATNPSEVEEANTTQAVSEIPVEQEEKIKKSSVHPRMLHLSYNKLKKRSIRVPDSVEEFSVLPEPTTHNPTKRGRSRSRHNLETLDERTTSGKKKILPAVHYNGDSSGYVVGKHTNYNGNGHLSHPSQIYSDWVEADWVKTLGMDEFFSMDKGLVKIKESGLYMLYAQIYYLDYHDTNGYRIYKNEEELLQCTTMTHSTERIFKGNTCYTSRVEQLKENDVISIRDLANSRYTIFEAGKSFFGLIKLK